MKNSILKTYSYLILIVLFTSCISEDEINVSSWKYDGGTRFYGDFFDFCDSNIFIHNGHLMMRGNIIGKCKAIDWNTIELKIDEDRAWYTFFGKCDE